METKHFVWGFIGIVVGWLTTDRYLKNLDEQVRLSDLEVARLQAELNK